MFKTALTALFTLAALQGHAAAQTDLRCEQFKPMTRLVKISRMQPVKRGKAWQEGTAKGVSYTVCDVRGMKTEEGEYDGKTLRLKTVYEHKEPAEARTICTGLKSEEKLTTTFSGEARSSLDEFCRKNKKRDFGVVLVYDRSPSATGSAEGLHSGKGPIRMIFRLYNSRGFVEEDQAFDPLMNLETRTSYTYDKGNNLSETLLSDPENRPMSRETWEKDKRTGAKTHSVYGETNELRKKTRYEYRADGTLDRETRTSYDAGEQVMERSEIRCDAKGGYLTELVYDGENAEPARELSYEHVYDKADNWTQRRRVRTIIYNGNRMPDTQYAPEITRRDLEYFAK